MLQTFSYTPADDDTDALADDVTGAGPFTMTATSAGDGLAHLIALSSTANLGSINMTLTGTDADGKTQTEVVAGPNNNTVYSTKYFLTLTTVAAASTLGAETMDVGYKDACVSPTICLNHKKVPFSVNMFCDISGTINYDVQHLFTTTQSLTSPPAQATWATHATITGKTADFEGVSTAPITAVRLKINSLTAGATASLTVIQAETC